MSAKTQQVTHTPGPWRQQFAKDHIHDSQGNRNPIFGVWGPEGDNLAVCKGVMAPNEANARLIAAAPELLARNYCPFCGCDQANTPGCDYCNCIQIGRAAIRKARGE